MLSQLSHKYPPFTHILSLMFQTDNRLVSLWFLLNKSFFPTEEQGIWPPAGSLSCVIFLRRCGCGSSPGALGRANRVKYSLRKTSRSNNIAMNVSRPLSSAGAFKAGSCYQRDANSALALAKVLRFPLNFPLENVSDNDICWLRVLLIS